MDLKSKIKHIASNKDEDKDKKPLTVVLIEGLATNAVLSIFLGITIGICRSFVPGNDINTFFRSIAITTFMGTFWIVTIPSAGAYFTYKAFKGN